MKLQVQCMKALLGERMLYFSTENPGGRSPNLHGAMQGPELAVRCIRRGFSIDLHYSTAYRSRDYSHNQRLDKKCRGSARLDVRSHHLRDLPQIVQRTHDPAYEILPVARL